MNKDRDFTEESRGPGLREQGRGRNAIAPHKIDWNGWKDIFWRLGREFNRDRVMLIAAGATFYLLLALFPAMAVLVSLFGLVADPARIVDQLSLLNGVLPSSAIDVIASQMRSFAAQNHATLTFGFVFGFLVTLWSANSGVKTLFEAMNVAYEETEKRSFVRLSLIALMFTLGIMVVATMFIVGVGIIPAVLGFVGLNAATETFISILRWPVLFVVAAIAISILYRYGPSRERAKWRWVTLGGILATALWLGTSMLFSWYLSNFADYNATYGSLGAVVGFLMWTWVSMVVLIMGAELDAEAEHQTARDSTTGSEKPMGQRGAQMADTLGRRRDAPRPPPENAEANSAAEASALPRNTANAARLAAALVALAAGWLWVRIRRRTDC